MNSQKKLKSKEVKVFFASKEAAQQARRRLEQKTEKDLRGFTRSKQKVQELSHKKYLD